MAINYATHWLVAQAAKQHTRANVQQLLGGEIIGHFGPPDLLITDGGQELVNTNIKSNLGTNYITQSAITPYHPQSNG